MHDRNIVVGLGKGSWLEMTDSRIWHSLYNRINGTKEHITKLLKTMT